MECSVDKQSTVQIYTPMDNDPVTVEEHLVSCFIDDIKDKNKITKDCIISYGPQRSGTALLWNILKECFPDRIIIKTHNYYDFMDNHIVIGVYRDIRDAALSRWRVMCLDSDIIPKQMTVTDFYDIKKNVDRDIEVLEQFMQLKNCYFIKYETFVDDFDKLFDFLEQVFKTTFFVSRRIDIKYRYSLNSVKTMLSNMNNQSFKTYDSKTHFHAKHISGSEGGYKRHMKPDLIKFMNKKYRNILIKLGYVDSVKSIIENYVQK